MDKTFLFICGFPKAGTTSLARTLHLTGKYFCPNREEPWFFTDREKIKRHGVIADSYTYSDLYKKSGSKICIDASVSYLNDLPSVVSRVNQEQLVAKARYLVLYRPVEERIGSMYRMFIRDGYIHPKLSLHEFVKIGLDCTDGKYGEIWEGPEDCPFIFPDIPFLKVGIANDTIRIINSFVGNQHGFLKDLNRALVSLKLPQVDFPTLENENISVTPRSRTTMYVVRPLLDRVPNYIRGQLKRCLFKLIYSSKRTNISVRDELKYLDPLYQDKFNKLLILDNEIRKLVQH